MSARASKLALIVLLVVLSLMASLIMSEPEIRKTEKFKTLRDIGEKMGSFKLNGPPTVSEDELEKLYEEFKSWPEHERRALRRLAKYRLLIDIALAPMQLESRPKLLDIHKYYIASQSVYQRGYYFETKPPRITAVSFDALIAKLTTPDSEPLEMQDLVAAKEESVELLKELNDLCEKGLIYEQQPRYEGLINFFNAHQARPLFVNVFPAMDYLKDVEALRLLYRERLTLSGMRFIEDNKLEFVARWQRQAGFLHAL